MELKLLIYILFVLVILLSIFSVYEFVHYRKLYVDVTDNVSSIFEGFKKQMLAIQNLTKQMIEFTNKTNKSIDDIKKDVRLNAKEIEGIAKKWKNK